MKHSQVGLDRYKTGSLLSRITAGGLLAISAAIGISPGALAQEACIEAARFVDVGSHEIGNLPFHVEGTEFEEPIARIHSLPTAIRMSVRFRRNGQKIFVHRTFEVPAPPRYGAISLEILRNIDRRVRVHVEQTRQRARATLQDWEFRYGRCDDSAAATTVSDPGSLQAALATLEPAMQSGSSYSEADSIEAERLVPRADASPLYTGAAGQAAI